MPIILRRRGSNLSVNTLINTDEYIQDMLRRFKLVDINNSYQELIDEAIENKLGYKEFLINLIKTEEAGKKKRSIDRKIKAASFESITTLDDYDYSFHNYQYMQKIKELLVLNFIENKENVILIGAPGVGKSRIATGLGIKACQTGKTVLFVNALELMTELSKYAEEGTIKKKLEKLSKIDLIIIDELGYMKMDKEKESIFFQLIRHRYEKNSLIITTNLPFGRWDEVFTSKLAATAILDRLIHHSHIISITGDSYRVKGKQKEEKA